MRDNPARMARPAVILAGVRTGGIFLAHCLSTHPRIFCDRSEPLNGKHIYYQLLRPDPVLILNCLTHQPFYHVSMCKVTFGQAVLPGVWEYIKANVPNVICLTRRNVLDQAISLCINNTGRARPSHSFTDLPAARVTLDPQIVVETIRLFTVEAKAMHKRLAEIPHTLDLYYEDLAGTEAHVGEMTLTYLKEETGRAICEFLGVPPMTLFSELRRTNPQPHGEIVLNWAEVRTAVANSAYAGYLEN